MLLISVLISALFREYAFGLIRDEPCTTEINLRPGICKLITDCKSVLQDIEAGRRHTRCEFEGLMEIVCCPAEQPKATTPSPSLLNKNSTISQQKCIEYANAIYEYDYDPKPGKPSKLEKYRKCAVAGFVVGGTKASPREFPHMALLGYDIGEDGMSWSCGGSLISDQFVLTAAHCLQTEVGTLKVVRLGDLNIARDDDDARPETFQVADYIVHPEYRSGSRYHDIGLVRVARKIQLNPYIRPACLPTEFAGTEQRATATVWGLTKYKGQYSDNLMMVDLDIFTHTQCNATHASAKGLENGIDERTQMCAGSINESKDTCQGDSGGPLQTYGQNCTYSVIGITSFGFFCGVVPGVYTRVYPYVNWIEEQIWGRTTNNKTF